jgi:cytochrome P450
LQLLIQNQNDYVQWSLEHASVRKDPEESSPDMITKRLAVVSFAAIQSSAITLTNLIFDLAACPLTTTYLSTMRSEVLSELDTENGVWTKASLARMVSLDSALRESMRLWGFVSRGVLKMVVKKEGVTLPGGLHIPQGVKVGVHAYPTHHDEAIYTGASTFDAFRFCRTGDDQRPDSDYSEKLAGAGKNRGTSLVTTSSNFMAFSHGRHAWCVSFPPVSFPIHL